MTASQAASLLKALTAANVQLVVVGDTGLGPTLRLVVASHPTNLAALGGVLDRMGAVLEAPATHDDGPVRLGGPEGAMTVTTRHGPVELLLGGPGGSLYALAVEAAEVKSVAGVDVHWIAALPPLRPARTRSGAAVARQMLTIVDALAPSTDAVGARGATKGAPRRTRPSSDDH